MCKSSSTRVCGINSSKPDLSDNSGFEELIPRNYIFLVTQGNLVNGSTIPKLNLFEQLPD